MISLTYQGTYSTQFSQFPFPWTPSSPIPFPLLPITGSYRGIMLLSSSKTISSNPFPPKPIPQQPLQRTLNSLIWMPLGGDGKEVFGIPSLLDTECYITKKEKRNMRGIWWTVPRHIMEWSTTVILPLFTMTGPISTTGSKDTVLSMIEQVLSYIKVCGRTMIQFPRILMGAPLTVPPNP